MEQEGVAEKQMLLIVTGVCSYKEWPGEPMKKVGEGEDLGPQACC